MANRNDLLRELATLRQQRAKMEADFNFASGQFVLRINQLESELGFLPIAEAPKAEAAQLDAEDKHPQLRQAQAVAEAAAS